MKNKKNNRFSEEKSLKEVLSNFKKSTNLQKGFLEIRVKEAWESELGPGVNTYTEKIIFKNKRLLVKLTSSTLKEELSYGKEKIKNLLNQKFEEDIINEIVFI
ncbi:MAG: DUF721 domain-containing protein [Bacteroidota bacterium]